MPRTNRFYLMIGAVSLLLLLLMFGWAAGLSPPSPRPVPTLSPDRRLLAIETNQARRPVQALYHLEALVSEHGWTSERHRLAGDLWFTLGDAPQALFHWQQARPDDPLTLQSVTRLYLMQEDWPAALEALQTLVGLQPDNPWANYHLGMLLAPSNPNQAQAHLQKAMQDPAFQEPARAVRVTLLENRSRQQIEGVDHVGVPVLVGLSLIEHDEWRYAELALSYANALYQAANDAPLPEALAYLSLARDKQGKDGASAIQQAVALRPDDPQIRFLEALHYRHTGAYDASLGAIIQAVALAPDNPTLYAELGTAYRLTGDLQQAEYWLRQAVAFSKNDPIFQNLLAQFYSDEAYNLGSDGLMALDSAIQNNPHNPDLLAGMGWAFYTLGDRDQGEAMIDEALQMAPDNTRAAYYKARVLLGTGTDDTRAQGLLRQVIAADGLFREEAQRILASLN